MIYSIKADKKSFRTIEFKPDFNVILAERTKASTDKDSRNGLGKSTMIEIIHFCLGGQKGETLSKPIMDDWTFTIELDIAGKRAQISRNTSKDKQLKIGIDTDFSNWIIKQSINDKLGLPVLSKNNWNKLLGIFFFGLPSLDVDEKYKPTFRSLISYFIRKNGQSGAYLNPFQHYHKQKSWDIQINNAFLLGLNWEYVSKLQTLKDRKKSIEQIKNAAQSGILSSFMGSIGELEARMIRLKTQVQKEEEELNSFKVHLQYSEIESMANLLTQELHELINENIIDKNLLDHYEQSLIDEEDANPESILKIYNDAGLHFPDNIKKKIDDVLNFHKQIVINRRVFLKSEIDRLKRKIATQEKLKGELSEKRSELMMILKNHKALEEYTKLQNIHQKTISELQNVIIKIDNLKKFEEGKSQLAIETELLTQEAKIDISQRQNQKEKAILFFNENSKTLYDVPGTLSIDIDNTGYKFGVSIERSGSQGISHMKIFCYDLMLAQLWSGKSSSPNLLIHDSIIFDGVDERQKAHAIELAARESKKHGFQYICSLNSDSIPLKDFSRGFDFSSYVRMTFTDATKEGGLLGLRF